MNTYIFYMTNKDGYRWIDEGDGWGGSQTEIVEAVNFKEALGHILSYWSLDETMFSTLDADDEIDVNNTFPININVTEIPATGSLVSENDIDTTLKAALNAIKDEVEKDFAEQQKAAIGKQKAVEKLKAEAQKLGLSLDDLR